MINSKVKEAENAVVDVRSRASRRGGNFAKDIGKGRKRAGKSEAYMASEPVDEMDESGSGSRDDRVHSHARMIDKLKQPLDSQFGRGRHRDTLSEPEHYARTPDELGHKTVQKNKTSSPSLP
jgi:hypothetical protein